MNTYKRLYEYVQKVVWIRTKGCMNTYKRLYEYVQKELKKFSENYKIKEK